MWSPSAIGCVAAGRRNVPPATGIRWPLGVCACAVAACLCAALTLAGDAQQHGEEEDMNLTALSKTLLAAAGLDDDLPYLHDLYWPLNDSWLLDNFDQFDHTHFENGQLFPEAHSTAAPVVRPPPGPPDPEFDSNLVTNVTAQLGGTAFLHCRVKNLGEHTVSWVRRRDWHILTSGLFTYTNDERFQVAHTNSDEDWSLQIKYVQKRDNGTYECQVATGGGTMSHYFNLHVVSPAAFILGSGEYHIGEGSTISLVCIIENSPTPPQYVFWYHNERVVNYDGSRAVAVSTEPGPRTHSRLVISRATRADSGNYTCSAPDTEPDTINVYVSQGDNTAAIQRQEASADHRSPPALLVLLVVTAVSRRLPRMRS